MFENQSKETLKMKISDVAKHFDISRPTLLYYDQIDLLKPSFRNEKDYRFYAQQDISKLEIILALKESGLSIKEIKKYMEGEREASSIDILVAQQEKIDQKIMALEKQRAIMEKRINLLKEFASLDLYEGILKDHYPALDIITEAIGYGPLMSYESAKKRLHNKINDKERLSSKFSIWFTLSNGDLSSLKMKYVYDIRKDSPKTDGMITYPESDFIRCLHYGSYHHIKETIEKLLDYARENNLVPIGDILFIPLFDYWELKTEDEFVNEILMPVRNKI